MGEGSAVQGKASGATIPASNLPLPAGAQTLSVDAQPLSADELRQIDAYWRACNYSAWGCCIWGEPTAAGPAEGGTHQEPSDRALGFGPGSEVSFGST